MIRRVYFSFLLVILFQHAGKSQCSSLGQNPSTAFPACGTTTFQQTTVPICGSTPLYVPGCTGGSSASYENKNPYWYKFTCFVSGTLGFVITPNNLGDDYDWQLYDITGRDPNEVFTNASLVISGNWSGSYGTTGASAGGVNYIQCASIPGNNAPRFASMPQLIAGHEYLLLVSHFTDTQSGYSLSFGGGTANITDPNEPHMASARAICDGTRGTIKLNKKMKCNSLTTSGSEFTLSPPLANFISATGFGCSGGFDMDSLSFVLDAPLPAGNYTINIRNGTDNNTIKDNCDRNIPVGESIPLVVYPIFPTPMDSISKTFCSPDELQLVFRKKIQCSSIAADGSDFDVSLISGSTTVTVAGAAGSCDADGLTSLIKVKLSAPIQTKGTHQVKLQKGSDNNTILDECNQETPAGATLNFNTKDTVNADFSHAIRYGCIRDTVNYFHNGRNEVNVWKWNFDNLRKSSVQNPVIYYASFGLKQTQLIVSNGVCSDTSAFVPILLDNELKAAFEVSSFVCPDETAMFLDKSIGNITSWQWDFGNGLQSNQQNPSPQRYFAPSQTTSVYPRLIVENNLGCFDTSVQKVVLPNSCYIAVPNAFTPNNDGLNDYLYPLNAYKAKDILFRIYNRGGQMIFETRDWTQKWDGSFKGQGAEPGTYVWVLIYTDGDTGKKVQLNGTTILLR